MTSQLKNLSVMERIEESASQVLSLNKHLIGTLISTKIKE
jgi:hypothetical protein